MKSLISNKLFLIFTCIVLIGNACSKEDELGWVDATVVDTGSGEAVESCGILIKIDSVLYAPTSLQDRYAKDKQKIKIKYELQDDYYPCAFGIPEYQKIEITKIKKR